MRGFTDGALRTELVRNRALLSVVCLAAKTPWCLMKYVQRWHRNACLPRRSTRNRTRPRSCVLIVRVPSSVPEGDSEYLRGGQDHKRREPCINVTTRRSSTSNGGTIDVKGGPRYFIPSGAAPGQDVPGRGATCGGPVWGTRALCGLRSGPRSPPHPARQPIASPGGPPPEY